MRFLGLLERYSQKIERIFFSNRFNQRILLMLFM